MFERSRGFDVDGGESWFGGSSGEFTGGVVNSPVVEFGGSSGAKRDLGQRRAVAGCEEGNGVECLVETQIPRTLPSGGIRG
eukprot:1083439-Prorocentrum_minimum.AAC.1